MANDGKFITIENGRKKQEQAINTSAGAGDASKIIRTDATGRIDTSFMPIGVVADTKTVIASEALSAGNLVSYWDDSGTIKVRKADATASGKEADGFVLAGVSSGAAASVYHEGTNNQLSGLTLGARYYLHTTAGGITPTAPSGSGNVVQYVGKAVSATELSFEPSDGVILA